MEITLNIVQVLNIISKIERENFEINLTPPHVCACPKPVSGFPTSYVVIFLVFSE